MKIKNVFLYYFTFTCKNNFINIAWCKQISNLEPPPPLLQRILNNEDHTTPLSVYIMNVHCTVHMKAEYSTYNLLNPFQVSPVCTALRMRICFLVYSIVSSGIWPLLFYLASVVVSSLTVHIWYRIIAYLRKVQEGLNHRSKIIFHVWVYMYIWVRGLVD